MSTKGLPIQNHNDLSPQESQIDWHQVCQVMFKNSLILNPLVTQPNGIKQGLNDLKICMGLVEHQPRKRLTEDYDQFYRLQEEKITRTYQQEEFFGQVLQARKSKAKGHRLVITGEGGIGKTTLLQEIAEWILEKTEDVPIWIHSEVIKKKPIYQYLQENWLDQVAKTQNLSSVDWQAAFEQLLNSGRVWLLLDGFNQISAIAPQLSKFSKQVQIILTCPTQISEAEQNAVLAFDIYRILELASPEQVRQFIDQWFGKHSHSPVINLLSQENRNSQERLAEKLCQALDEPGKQNWQQFLNNPFRLALLCRLWQQQSQELPQTKAGLYQQLIAEFYRWKADTIATTSQQQQQLNGVLARLALQAIETGSFPFSLRHAFFSERLGEDPSLLQLAIKLGWINSSAVAPDKPEQQIYAFSDLTFQSYFAALAVEDWHFFLNNEIEDAESPIQHSKGNYRVFEPQWKEVILFWLGREDIPKQQKEAFIKALIEFDDGCGQENFYGKRAYFIAAASIAEFTDSSKTEEIIRQILAWGFFYGQEQINNDLHQEIAENAKAILLETNRSQAIAALLQLIQSSEDQEIQSQAFESLEKIAINNREAISTLEKWLNIYKSDWIRWQVAESLGKINPGNLKAITAFTQQLDNPNDAKIRQTAFNGLEKIGKGNRKAIAALIALLRIPESPTTQRQAFQCLEEIGKGNSTAIAALVQLIRTTRDEGMQRQVAVSLEKIDPSNPTAIAVLVQLLQAAGDEDIRRQAIYSLGEIEPGNSEAIAALVQLLNTTEDMYTCWLTLSSLGKIGAGNRAAIDALVKLIQSTDQILLRKDAIESLGKIDPGNPVAISALVKMIQSTTDEAIRAEAAESLGNIDPGNPDAINVLTKVLHETEEKFTRRQAAYSLGKIDPGNLEALMTLVQILRSNPDSDIGSLAAESLGEIGVNNPAAIATLIRLFHSTHHPETLKRAIASLGKIGSGNRETLTTLLNLVQSAHDESTRLQAAHSLIHILRDKQMVQVVTTLRDHFLAHSYDLACYQVIWHCASNLPYVEFYQAWHYYPLTIHPKITNDKGESNLSRADGNGANLSREIPQSVSNSLISKDITLAHLPESLQEFIQKDTELKGIIRLICINKSEFIDPDNPTVDIYDQMLMQNCPEFQHGLPETMAKLRLYINNLRRNYPDYILVLLFYDKGIISEQQGFSVSFLEKLSKFDGLIGVVTEQTLVKLTQFSPDHPQLVESIIEWMREGSNSEIRNPSLSLWDFPFSEV